MKLNRTLVLLLSAGLIVLGAFLPSIVGNRQDAAVEGEILFATVSDIQLVFSENDTTLRETISILCTDPDAVEIPADLANLKLSRVETAAMDMANRLQEEEIGFLLYPLDGPPENAEFFVDSCQPVLSSSNLVSGLNNIFWYVEVVSTDRKQFLGLVVDDRTGTICSMNYYDEHIEHSKDRMQTILYTFSYLYLEELGEEFFDYSCNDILKEAQSPTDNSYLASSIRWWAKDYEYRTTFFVNNNGFYTYLATQAY